VFLAVNLAAKMDDFFNFWSVRFSFSQNFSYYHREITVRTFGDLFGGQIMNLGALALEAYQFNRTRSMGFSFCFFPGHLRLFFNIHGYIPFSKVKMLNTFQKTAAVELNRIPSVKSLSIFNPARTFCPRIINSVLPFKTSPTVIFLITSRHGEIKIF